MGYPIFTFTPRGGTQITVPFSGVTRQLSKWQGGPTGDANVTITQGGRAAAVVHDVFEEYDIEIPGIRPTASSAWSTLYAGLHSWWEHAFPFGVFAFALDSSQSSSTTLSGSVAYNTTACSVASTAGFSAGDWVYIEDAVDPTKWTRRKINSVASGLTMTDNFGRPFAAASVVRHARYLPMAICLTRNMPLLEREAGKGYDLWDFKATFRTVRS